MSSNALAGWTVLVLDEFQATVRHSEHLPFLLKGLSDEHPKVSLVMAGSQRHLMERLVTSEGAPLYGTAERVSLGPIPDDQMSAYLKERAAEGGKLMDDAAAELVLDLAGPVPNDIQHLAFEAFGSAGRRVTSSDVMRGMRLAVERESGLFAERFAPLSPGQARVLVALATGPERPIFTAAFAREAGLSSGQSVKKAIDAMAEDETVVLRSRRWVVSDPFFAMWLRQNMST